MKWDDLIGHHRQRQWFARALESGRMASSFLFIGTEGIGKRTFARLVAKSVLCRSTSPDSLDFCGSCEDCVQVDAGTHPDLIEVAKPEDRAEIPTELLIGSRERRNREGMCHDLSMKPRGGRRKIAILDDADHLNEEGANCLLKTLEEPPGRSILFLVGTSMQRQLPTIRSRCQSILFQPLTVDELAELVLRLDLAQSADSARQLAELSEGSLMVAQGLADPQMQAFRSMLWTALARSALPITRLIKECDGLVGEAGKEARRRRDRLKLLMYMAAEFYRAVALLQQTDPAHAADLVQNKELRELAMSVARRATCGPQDAIRCWDRCLRGIEQVERNANQATLIEAWFCDLAYSSRA
ncbi:MAG: AAA family ATPase [Planctomycetota bacterium]|nr:MAG: AAA family ATPase [Planctomycetota bacterium]